jgi:hypothetical protein
MKVEVNKIQLDAVKSALAEIKNGAPRAISSAMNATMTTVQTQAVKAIGQDLNLAAKRIKSDFKIKKSSWKDLAGFVSATGAPIGLVNFAARQTKTGVTVKVKRTGVRRLLPHAFLAAGRKQAGYHVWWRAKVWGRPVNPALAYGKLPKKYRFPEGPKGERGVHRLTGPRIEDIFAADRIYNPIRLLAAEKFAENLVKKTEETLRRFG